MDNTQLSLPYEEIKGLASRDYLRKRFTITSKTAYTIPFNEIQLREGFIKREELEVNELAEELFTGGQKTPFDLDVLPDGRVFLFRGRRRYAAYMLLIEQERFKPESPVPFFPTEKNVTELDRMVDQYTYNHHSKPYTPLEQAAVAFEVKHNYGEELSNEKIASLFGVSRQTIDNLILIAEATDDVKNQIREGSMSFTNAVSFVRSQRKQSKEADKKEKESHETKATVNNEPEDLLAKDLEELKELEDRADEFKQREADKAARDLDRLLEISVEVLVNRDSLIPHIGKRFAAPAYGIWEEDFVDPDSGEVVKIERQQLLLAKDQEVNETAIDLLIANNAKSVFIYKVHTAAPSVLTEFIEEGKKEKGFDESRAEIKSIQDAIKAGDKIEAIVSKLDAPDQVKQDISYQVHWLQKNLADARQWIHTHKPR